MAIFSVVIVVVSGILCALLAQSRDRNAMQWFGIGCLFPLIGLLILAFIPPSPKVPDEDPPPADQVPLDQRYDYRIDAELKNLD